MDHGRDGAGSRPLVLGIDAGGTMTDTFLVDETGRFVVGKAATTPWDESLGFLESVEDALASWGSPPLERLFSELDVVLYSGTTMLNTLLSRTGRRLGLIVTKGFEDCVVQGRGLQSWAGYAYADRLHPVTHEHPDPLVERSLIRGVTERIDHFGAVAIPLYEHEMAAAARELGTLGIEALCICLLHSYANPAHERAAGRIAREVLDSVGAGAVPVFISAEVRPVIRETSRLNSTLIEAYAAAPVRVQLHRIERAVQQLGFKHELQTVLSYGGLANIRHPRLHETLVSGPIGGILGARHLARAIGAANVVVSDMGGTSFDIGAITAGQLPIEPEPALAGLKLNLPMIELESIAAGAGTIVRVDPVTGRPVLGPDGAGAFPGPVCFGHGGQSATVCDCDALLGYLNPDYFLGGRVHLDLEQAKRAVQEQVTGPIGVELYEGAEGIVRLLEAEAREALRRTVEARGFDVTEYVLMSYGGAGPLHVAGYADGLPFDSVLTFPFAAAFSAFGCTCADYLHRYSRSVHLEVSAALDPATGDALAAELDTAWAALEQQALDEMAAEGHDPRCATLQRFAMIRYAGQLSDVEVLAPSNALRDAAGLGELLAEFELAYERMHRRVSRYREAGFLVAELGVLAVVEKVKPRIERRELAGATPSAAARKGCREIYWAGDWVRASVFEMDALCAGNLVRGPAVIEHPATTFVVPEGKQASLDEWGIFHLEAC